MVDPEWVQGALLHSTACKSNDLDGLDLADGDVLIVISQSCDILNDDERHVEIHVGREIANVDGNNTYRKNPRTLDLDTEIDGARRSLRISQADRKQIPRKRLAKAKRAGLLPEADIRLLARWTADRYTRPAFPDAFNERRRPSRDRIAKAAKRDGVDLSGIYIALETEAELLVEEPYNVFVLGVVPHNVATDTARWQIACAAVNEIVEALRCPGIDVLDSETRSEANVSLEDIKQFFRLELDYISERGGTEPSVDQ